MRASSLTLAELVLLTEEFEALIRAGVPLDVGFRSSAARMPARLQVVVEELSEQLQRGATLPQAMASLGDALPGPFRTLVEIGARTGRLTEALRGLSTFGAVVLELQKTLWAAVVYPAALLLLGFGLFVFLVTNVVPPMAEFYVDLRVAPPVWLRTGLFLNETALTWALGIPLVVIIVWLGTWVTRSPAWHPVPDLGGLGRLIPGMSRAIRDSEYARFGQLLSLLVDAQVPIPEALSIVSQSVSDPQLRRWCESETLRAAAGEAGGRLQPGTIPPLVHWFLSRGQQEGELAPALRQMAALYRERALLRMDRMVHFWPVAITLFLGILFVGIYSVATFGTLVDLWRRLPG